LFLTLMLIYNIPRKDALLTSLEGTQFLFPTCYYMRTRTTWSSHYTC
jgi:hypothetical protein